ncbi:MAG: peptidoglycan-binding protein, partial [Rhizobiaceae bacterium]|nr:peptidoglycan-binding protein [Rhizobiaceae bacterium]
MSMNNKRSYLDSINAGRRRRPNPSFQDMDRTLARLEGRGDTEREAYQAPRRNDRQRYRDEEFSNYPEQYERFEAPRGEARRDPLDSLARDMGRARQQEDSLGAVTRVASELQALREELRQQMGQGLRREFDSLRSDIERLSVMAPSANAGEIGAEFERLSDAVRSLSERSDDRSVNMLRLELEKVKGALGELAREETLRSVDRRWSSLESKIDRAPDRAQFEPTLKALNSQLERIGQAVDSLPESLS